MQISKLTKNAELILNGVNIELKNIILNDKELDSSQYTIEDENLYTKKSTNINILLNRVRQDQKKESRKKLLFTAATSLGVVLFGVLIF